MSDKDDTKRTYYFTFGNNNKYVMIRNKSYLDARAEMVKHFSDNWAFQYDNVQVVKGNKLSGLEELTFYD